MHNSYKNEIPRGRFNPQIKIFVYGKLQHIAEMN